MKVSKTIQNKNPKGIIFTDFDGTLFSKERLITEKNYQSLRDARELGYLTVINTGRSLYSFRRIAEKLNKPIEEYFDYLIFSSGAGTISCSEKIRGNAITLSADDLLETENLDVNNAQNAASIFFKEGIDFMIQQCVPENHKFVYIKSNGNLNPDYYRRIEIYENFAKSYELLENETEIEALKRICTQGVSQLVGVIPPMVGKGAEYYHKRIYDYLVEKIKGVNVIRTTSPIDKKSLWVEVFNLNASKAKAASRLAAKYNLTEKESLSIGNDFNDYEMIAWATMGRVVDDAPPELREKFITCGLPEKSAVANAIYEFIR